MTVSLIQTAWPGPLAHLSPAHRQSGPIMGDVASTVSLIVVPVPQVTGLTEGFHFSDVNADSISALKCHSHIP